MINRSGAFLSIHHIGGRAGTREFPVMEAFEKDMESVLYDADQSCIEAIIHSTRHLASKTVVLPWLIGGVTGEADFYITGDRYASSLSKILPEKSAYYSYTLNFAWDCDPESYQIDEKVRLKMTTLDDIHDGKTPQETLPPDFLSIDAEGAEFDILSGAKDLLVRHIICIKAEVAFLPFRENHKMVHEVQAYLEKKGFSMVDLTPFRSDGKYHRPLPIGLRGHGIDGFGDALFFKEGDRIVAGHLNPAADLIKGAFMAISFSKFETAHGYLDLLKKYPDALAAVPDEPSYARFVKEFARIRDRYPRIFPIPFSIIFPTLESRKNRFQESLEQPDKGRLREAYFRRINFQDFKKNLPVIFTGTPIGVEDLCLKYGLTGQAEILMEKRHQQIIGLLNRLGFLAKDDEGNFVIDHQALLSYEQSF